MIIGVELTNLNNIKYNNAKKLLHFLFNYYTIQKVDTIFKDCQNSNEIN